MEDKKPKQREIKNHTVALMVATALFFDVIQWLLAWIFMDWLAGFFAFMTFFVWFKLYGMKFMTHKRLVTMGGAFIIEIVPILSALPAWTGAVTILILDYKAKRAIAAISEGTAMGTVTHITSSNRTNPYFQDKKPVENSMDTPTPRPSFDIPRRQPANYPSKAPLDFETNRNLKKDKASSPGVREDRPENKESLAA